MEQFNKALSFILGLVVVVIFIAVATGKINLKGKLGPTPTGSSKITPTVSPSKTITLKQTTQKAQTTQTNTTAQKQKTTKQAAAKPTTIPINPNYHRYGQSSGTVATIPNTGPELLLPLALSSLLGGSLLKRFVGKKKTKGLE